MYRLRHLQKIEAIHPSPSPFRHPFRISAFALLFAEGETELGFGMEEGELGEELSNLCHHFRYPLLQSPAIPLQPHICFLGFLLHLEGGRKGAENNAFPTQPGSNPSPRPHQPPTYKSYFGLLRTRFSRTERRKGEGKPFICVKKREESHSPPFPNPRTLLLYRYRINNPRKKGGSLGHCHTFGEAESPFIPKSPSFRKKSLPSSGLQKVFSFPFPRSPLAQKGGRRRNGLSHLLFS